jgi:hypothetical protein
VSNFKNCSSVGALVEPVGYYIRCRLEFGEIFLTKYNINTSIILFSIHLREDKEGDEEQEEPVDESGQGLRAYISIAELLVGTPL